eukprot:TRINITY_DN11273_c0_g1_i1.p1 TRINITY_DN11273_c0_g1~~TRINITY_DN11273_c0_g1_i1.p1  ORF type:complete len:319 (+),score=55.44 TRINITY_DN11273_c0_g1_i1:81-1037(+)
MMERITEAVKSWWVEAESPTKLYSTRIGSRGVVAEMQSVVAEKIGGEYKHIGFVYRSMVYMALPMIELFNFLSDFEETSDTKKEREWYRFASFLGLVPVVVSFIFYEINYAKIVIYYWFLQYGIIVDFRATPMLRDPPTVTSLAYVVLFAPISMMFVPTWFDSFEVVTNLLVFLTIALTLSNTESELMTMKEMTQVVKLDQLSRFCLVPGDAVYAFFQTQVRQNLPKLRSLKRRLQDQKIKVTWKHYLDEGLVIRMSDFITFYDEQDWRPHYKAEFPLRSVLGYLCYSEEPQLTSLAEKMDHRDWVQSSLQAIPTDMN